MAGFADGAVFHAYHAYECVLSAMIAAHGFPVPPAGRTRLPGPGGRTIMGYPSPGGGIVDSSGHRARIFLFDELADRARPYFATHGLLSRFLTPEDRMDSLYYDATFDQMPSEKYSHSHASGLLPTVHQFAREVWREIR
jgi:hypothetical protein